MRSDISDSSTLQPQWTLPCGRMVVKRGAARLAVAVAPMLLAAAVIAGAQPQGKVPRIGYIQTATPEEQAALTEAFVEGLRELGYVDGRNIVIERRFAWGKQELLPELAAELVRLNVDVIVTGGNPVIAAVKQATATIPVVMAAGRDPVGSGFVASLPRPGGNITGVTSDPAPDVQGKRLELLKEAVPRATRVAVLWNPLPPGAEIYRQTVENAAGKLGISLQIVAVRGRNEFDDAFAQMSRQRADGVVVLPDPIFFTARKEVVELTAKHRLPAVFHAMEFVQIGGLMSYGSSLDYQFRRAAVYVDKILKGAKPGELAVEQVAKIDVAINLKTARALGVAIPASLRVRADHIIE